MEDLRNESKSQKSELGIERKSEESKEENKQADSSVENKYLGERKFLN